jgi:protein involved in ribonucleotide reduction|tara:strand:- start:179 stop:649 length:471 start_codon:yes stop_codon:yes gene_type:complete
MIVGREFDYFILQEKEWGGDGMMIAFYSMTGNTRRFIRNAQVAEQYDTYEINASNSSEQIREPFILVTGTYGFGGVPDEVKTFLEVNHELMVGVASSGNRNWGNNFARAGEHISDEYGVPLLMKFELHGNQKDREEFIEKAGAMHESLGRKEIQPY